MRRSLGVWRKKVAATARQLAAWGLVSGSSGNVSRRVDKLVFITPSGITYEFLHPQQVVVMELDSPLISPGNYGPEAPSSEWRLHFSIYRAREDVRAIVHTHSPYATAASLGGRLSVLHDEGKLLFGDELPVSAHAPPGTWALAQAVTQALGRGKAALIARHGAVTVGYTLREALLYALKLEELAQVAFLARSDSA